MKTGRQTARSGLVGALALATVPLLAAAVATAPAQAQTRAPEGAIHIILGTSAGGTPDVVWRRAARILNEQGIIDNPLVIENRTGGSWMVATNYVLGREGDENTFLAFAQPTLVTPIVQKLEPVHDKLTPIAMFIQADLVVVVRPDSPFQSLSDLVEAARNEPHGVSMAGAHTGGTAQLALGLIETAADIEVNYIPFDGGGAATAAFLGGHVDMIIVNPDEALPHVEAGKGRMVAILNEERRAEPELADIPTAREQGVDVVWGQMWGLYGPPGLDPAIVAWWDEKLREMVATEEWKSWLAESHRRSTYVGPDRIAQHLEELRDVHHAALKAIGMAE